MDQIKSRNYITVCLSLLGWIGIQLFCYQVIGLTYSQNSFFMVFFLPAIIGALVFVKLQGDPMRRMAWLVGMLPGPAVVFIGFMAFMSNMHPETIIWAVAIAFGESIAAMVGASLAILGTAILVKKVTPRKVVVKRPSESKTQSNP